MRSDYFLPNEMEEFTGCGTYIQYLCVDNQQKKINLSQEKTTFLLNQSFPSLGLLFAFLAISHA